jgi:hypothetical protein
MPRTAGVYYCILRKIRLQNGKEGTHPESGGRGQGRGCGGGEHGGTAVAAIGSVLHVRVCACPL